MLKYFSILLVSFSLILPAGNILAKQIIKDTDIEALTFIAHAIADDDIELLKRILTHNINLKAVDEAGFNTLFYAVRHNRPHMVPILLEYGVPINAKEPEEGMTALAMAAFDGKYEIVEILLSNNADIHIKDNYDMTALELAREHGNTAIADLLIAFGAE